MVVFVTTTVYYSMCILARSSVCRVQRERGRRASDSERSEESRVYRTAGIHTCNVCVHMCLFDVALAASCTRHRVTGTRYTGYSTPAFYGPTSYSLAGRVVCELTEPVTASVSDTKRDQ